MDAARIQLPLALTPNNGLMVSARIHAAIITFAPPILAVSQIVRAMTALMVANASTDITSQHSKPNVFVILGAFGK
jgi:hypothetical protein